MTSSPLRQFFPALGVVVLLGLPLLLLAEKAGLGLLSGAEK
jgi:hypothetical protein